MPQPVSVCGSTVFLKEKFGQMPITKGKGVKTRGQLQEPLSAADATEQQCRIHGSVVLAVDEVKPKTWGRCCSCEGRRHRDVSPLMKWTGLRRIRQGVGHRDSRVRQRAHVGMGIATTTERQGDASVWGREGRQIVDGHF